MSNPNRTVYAARNRTYLLLSEARCYCRTEAEVLQDKIKAEYPYRIVKVVSIKMGPKEKPFTAYMVRSYTKENT